MALTFRDLLNRLAQMEGTSFDQWNEAKIAQRVALLNLAMRSNWKTNNPKFAYPFTVTSGTVSVTGGKIDPNDLGDSSWCSPWTADPRPAGNRAEPVDAIVGDDGVYPVEARTSVFAFYRYNCPQGVYVAADSYATPANIPEALGDIVPLTALITLYVSLQQFDAVNALKGTYGEPTKMRESLESALLQSGMPWQDNTLVLSPAATGTAAIPGIVEITENYIAVRTPLGAIRYWALSNEIP